jgi:hypothetical protein
MGGPYVRAVDAALTWLAGYLEGPAPADAVFLVLGDHQPAAQVSGPSATRDVPVHVIGVPGPLLEALRAAGFQAGLRPSAETFGTMPALRDVLIESLHTGAAAAGAGAPIGRGGGAAPTPGPSEGR